ncbi:MAG: hypothetical protein JO228_01065 [Xanthobacteraceae bacterium]|nr:hypothetical protein [Xanthobacteraceae bacterium]
MQTLANWLSRYFPVVIPFFNRLIINFFASSTVPRPHRFSLWSPSRPTTPAPERIPVTTSRVSLSNNPISAPPCYTSWPSLFDRTFTARHLPTRSDTCSAVLPPEADVMRLFERTGPMTPNPRSSLLFCFFAQWFTDSFLRTHPFDPRRTTSNHEIDMCQIYGLDEPSTWALRSGVGGRLKSRTSNGYEYPAFLWKDGEIDRDFYDPEHEIGLTYLRAGRKQSWVDAVEVSLKGATTDPARRDWFYASGLDRGGSTIAYSAFNTIFLREHNRIAGVLAKAQPKWDDDRLFETARLVNIRQVLGIVVNDYIRHIGGSFPFALDRSFAEGKRWYRTNRVSIEFNLLYRWHSLVPDEFSLSGSVLENDQFRYNNALLEKCGVEQLLTDASSQRAGRVGLHNTPIFLIDPAEKHSLKMSRDFALQPFNAYRDHFGLKPYGTIDEFADNPDVAEDIKRLYKGDMNAVELTVGLFGEKRGENDCMPETIVAMVAYDAFTHILTNPVLSTQVHCPQTFSDAGWDIIQQNAGLEEVVKRNCDPKKKVLVSLSAPDLN